MGRVQEGLVRISVGMEDEETLLGWVGKALCAAEAVVCGSEEA